MTRPPATPDDIRRWLARHPRLPVNHAAFWLRVRIPEIEAVLRADRERAAAQYRRRHKRPPPPKPVHIPTPKELERIKRAIRRSERAQRKLARGGTTPRDSAIRVFVHTGRAVYRSE